MEIRFSDYLNNGLVENVKNINNSKHATAKIETPKPQPIKDVWDVLATPFTTTFDLAEDVVSGAARSIEGIVDWGIGVVGSVGGALGANNFEKALADAAKYDFTGNTISKLDDWAEETSLLSYENKVTDIIHSVGAGVGGMLPAIAVSAVTANPAIGTAVFSAGAAGQATQEALNEGASLGRATLYGTLSGATEGAIEYASGALGGLNPFNTGAIKGLFSKGAGKAIMGMIEEGTEEVISDLINPFWKKITYSGKYDMPEFEDMLESFVVGGLTAGVMGGAGQVVNMAKYGVDGNKAQNILNQIGDLNQRQYNAEMRDAFKNNPNLQKQFNEERSRLTKEFGELVGKIKEKSQRKYDKFSINNDIDSIVNFDARKSIATDLVNQLNKEFGTDIKIEITDGLTQSRSSNQIDSSFDADTNTLYINNNSNNNVAKIIGSQLSKIMESNNNINIKNTILTEIGKTNLNSERAKIRAIENNGKLTDSQIDDMIVANWLGENITKDYKSVAKVLGMNTESESKLNKVLNTLKSLKKGSNLNETSVVGSEIQTTINAIENTLNEIKKNKTIKTTKTTETNGDNGVIDATIVQKQEQTKLDIDNENVEPNKTTEAQTTTEISEVREQIKPDEVVDKKEIRKYEEEEKVKFKETPPKSTEELLNETKEKVKTTNIKTETNIKETVEQYKQNIKDIIDNRTRYIEKLQIQFTNAFAGIENRVKDGLEKKGLSKEASVKEARKVLAKIAKISRVQSSAGETIKKDLYDGIFKEIQEKGMEYANMFDTYLQLRKHLKTLEIEMVKSKDGMLVEEKEYIEKQGKVFPELNLEDTVKLIVEIEKNPEYRDFKVYASKVYAYLENLMKIRKETGIVNDKQIKFMKDYYSQNGENWYVPSYRVETHPTAALTGGSTSVGVNKGIKGMKGSTRDIQSVFTSISQQTYDVYKQSAINDLFKVVNEYSPDSFEETNQKSITTREDIEGGIQPKQNEVFYYKDGVKTIYKVEENVALGFDSLRNKPNVWENNAVMKTTQKLVSTLKKYTTEFNPFFAVRNLFRDASDAFIFTKYGKNLLKRYKESLKLINQKGEIYDTYIRNGGLSNSFFDREYGLNLEKKNKLAEKISTINEVCELIPRFSEYIESIKASSPEAVRKDGTIDMSKVSQENIDLAMLDASEVTVNFGRSGTFTRKLNRYLMPYLNAAVQGWCKTYNTFVHPVSVRAWGMSMAKVVMMALPTIIFNEIMLGDDDDYKALSDEVKGSYFLIKTGENKFFRIPRGRVEAVLGDAMQRTIRTARGQENAFKGYAETTLKNVSPVENMTRTILSPITDVKTNVAWHGGKIENASMEKLPLNERYDNNTSVIARTLAVLPLGISAKKWHYLLDQYSGVLGDVVLPLTSKDKSSLFKISGLTINNIDNSKYTVDYYDKLEELQQANASSKGDNVDKAKLRYFNKMNTKISELYKEMKEKTDNEEILATKALIVGLQRETLESVDIFGKTLEKYRYGLNDDTFYEDYYLEAMRECFGAEYALSSYNKNVYEKAVKFNKAGIDYDTFYSVYFDSQDIIPDYDEEDKAIPGSKKQKVTNYIKQLNLTATQKYILMGMLGYKNTNGEDSVKSHLMRNGFTGEELTDMMKMCGY